MTATLRNPKSTDFIPPASIDVDGIRHYYQHDVPVVKGDDMGKHVSMYYSSYAESFAYLDADTGETVELPDDFWEMTDPERVEAIRMNCEDAEDRRFHADRNDGEVRLGRAVDVFGENGIDGKGWWEGEA